MGRAMRKLAGHGLAGGDAAHPRGADGRFVKAGGGGAAAAMPGPARRRLAARPQDRLSGSAAPLPVPESARPYHRSTAGIEDMVRRVENRDGATEVPLAGGHSAESTNLVTWPDGTKMVRKVGSAEEEHASSMVGRAIGVDAPRVYRSGEREVWMDFVDDARTWAQIKPGETDGIREAEIIGSKPGQLIGLFDLMINNYDRNSGNWMMRDDESLVAIDHGNGGLFPRDGVPQISSRLPFTMNLIDHRGIRDNSITPAEITEMRRNLEALRPDFEHASQGKWLQHALAVLAKVEPHAKGIPPPRWWEED